MLTGFEYVDQLPIIIDTSIRTLNPIPLSLGDLLFLGGGGEKTHFFFFFPQGGGGGDKPQKKPHTPERIQDIFFG